MAFFAFTAHKLHFSFMTASRPNTFFPLVKKQKPTLKYVHGTADGHNWLRGEPSAAKSIPEGN